MRTLMILMAVLLGTQAVEAGGGPSWEGMGTKEGVEVERKTMPDSALFAFRGEGSFDVPIGRLITVLKTPEIAVEWVDLMTEHTVVRSIGQNKNLIYESYGLPWPISDRDYVMHEKYSYDESQRVFTIDYESVEDAAKPVREDHVRAMAYRTFWRLTMLDNGRTKVEVEVFTDPKGALPAWLINLIQKDWPWKTIDGLVNRARKEDIKPDPAVAGWAQ
tara:strand:- start:238 stop:891 length:654 start_codon:yes stop_codon:yes gene_type:complete